jgi:hypothetical protein
MMTTTMMKERDQIKTTQVTKMIPYLHACLLALLFCISLVSALGIDFSCLFLLATCNVDTLCAGGGTLLYSFLIMRGYIFFFLDFLTDGLVLRFLTLPSPSSYQWITAPLLLWVMNAARSFSLLAAASTTMQPDTIGYARCTSETTKVYSRREASLNLQKGPC